MRAIFAAAAICSVMFVAWFASPGLDAQSLGPLVADPQHYRLEFQNQWVRVTREQMAPHGTMTMHQHPQPGAVIVFLTDRHNRLISPEGTVQEFRNRAGELMWSNP